MKQVLLFGTFDTLHPGHEYILRESQKLGDLTVVVAQDHNVEHIKGRLPAHTAEERKSSVQKIVPKARVLLGDKEDYFKPIADLNPDCIVLGYDQCLPPGMKEASLPCEVVRMDAFEPDTYKSSLLREEK